MLHDEKKKSDNNKKQHGERCNSSETSDMYFVSVWKSARASGYCRCLRSFSRSFFFSALVYILSFFLVCKIISQHETYTSSKLIILLANEMASYYEVEKDAKWACAFSSLKNIKLSCSLTCAAFLVIMRVCSWDRKNARELCGCKRKERR